MLFADCFGDLLSRSGEDLWQRNQLADCLLDITGESRPRCQLDRRIGVQHYLLDRHVELDPRRAGPCLLTEGRHQLLEFLGIGGVECARWTSGRVLRPSKAAMSAVLAEPEYAVTVAGDQYGRGVAPQSCEMTTQHGDAAVGVRDALQRRPPWQYPRRRTLPSCAQRHTNIEPAASDLDSGQNVAGEQCGTIKMRRISLSVSCSCW